MNDINSLELKQIRNTNISFRTYPSIADQLEEVYGNKYKGAQLICDNWLSIRNLIIKELAEKLTKEELCFLVETYKILTNPNGVFSDIYLYSKIMGFVELIKKMENFNSNLFKLKDEAGKVDIKLLKPKSDALTPVKIFFLEDLCKTYKGDGEIKDYIERLYKT